MRIYGAGLAGLIAANMLRRFRPNVHEIQTSLPNNHHALLRFRSDAVAQATGIPFRKVKVQKAIYFRGETYTQTNLRFNNMYASKVIGSVIDRSILNLEPCERWIAPPDFIQQLAAQSQCDIVYGSELTLSGYDPEESVISTIPMSSLMDIMEWKDKPEFRCRPVTNISMEIEDCNVYQTVYAPGHEEEWYRASLTGNQLIVEAIDLEPINEDEAETICLSALNCFGISPKDWRGPRVRVQKMGKIVPVDDLARRQFILAMSDLHHIYSLGRFATWRQLLLDDIVNDVRIIEQFITQRDSYAQRLYANR